MPSAWLAPALGAIPATCMLLCTFLGLGIQVSPTITGALQHFGAGVLLCTIGTELLPEMVNAKGFHENVASGIGFFAAVFLFIVLGIVLPETEEEEDNEIDSQAANMGNNEDSQKSSMTNNAMRRRRDSLLTVATRSSLNIIASDSANETRPISEDQPLLPSSDAATTFKPFPMALVVAVAVDSALDGLLIGIAIAAGPSAGPMMAASLSVEMGFLGLTLATALHGHPSAKSIPAACLGPIVLVLGSFVGGLLSNLLSHSPVLLAGLLGFGTSALLFMVAEELLLEAHANGAEHVWWVDLQLYIGFFASCMFGKIFPDG